MKDNQTIIASVVAHIDHGKTTLIDSLVASQGKISKLIAGDLRYMDTRNDEQERGITLKMSAISLKYENTTFNILDTPGHIDFEFLLEDASILSDVFIIIVDIVEGITPRTYSLLNYVNCDQSLIVINKMDKAETFDDALEKANNVIYLVNEILGINCFSWTNNNVVLCSATFCYGISNESSKHILKRDNTTMELALKFLFYIEKQIQINNIENICRKYKITNRSRKNILSVIMPLASVIFNSIKQVYKKILLIEKLKNGQLPLKIKGQEFSSDTLLFASLAVNNLSKNEKLKFISRLFTGRILKGDVLYNNGLPCRITTIYIFNLDELVEVEFVDQPSILCICAEINKNSILSSQKDLKYEYIQKMHPFYRSTLLFDKYVEIEKAKQVLRALICTEQCLKLKIDKFNRLVVLSSGKVQVEKIIEDLKSCDINVNYAEDEFHFCEYPTKISEYNFKNDLYEIKIKIYKNVEIPSKVYTDEFNNRFDVISQTDKELILSILEIYVTSGPLINGFIRDTTFEILFNRKPEFDNQDDLYLEIKKHIKVAFKDSHPAIAPYCYKADISLREEYYGGVYKCIQQYNCFIEVENYIDTTAFYVLEVLIPYFVYDSMIENVRICTKGTAYIKTSEYEYLYRSDYSSHINKIRKARGLYSGEKLIEDPEKQRTLKK